MEALRYLSLISQVGFTMVTPVLLCTLIGIKLEDKFHFPFILIFLLLGVISGCLSGFKLIMNTIKKMDKRKIEADLQEQENSFALPKRESRIFKNKDE
jgi:putative F0F1-ATPase subunit (ATPase_gene1)